MTDLSVIDTGLSYRLDSPVQIRVRHRDRRYDLDDDGAAVSLAGKRYGWLSEASRVVAAQGFNVNRRGVVFVPAVEGRGIGKPARRVAGAPPAGALRLLRV